MKIILSYIINSEIENYLIEKGLEIIKTKPFSAEKNSVLMHPDIQCFSDKNILFTYKNLSEYYSLYTDAISVSRETLESQYPKDIKFNAFKAENYIFCNEKFLDKKLLSYLKSSYKVINVNQGYSNCSSLYLGKNTVATSDKGMEKAFELSGFKTIFIDNKDITLKDYDHGFIGGSAIRLNDEIVFFGNVEIPKYKNLTSFLDENEVKYKSFPFPLEDYGSAVLFENTQPQ